MKKIEIVEIKVTGMTCDSCRDHVEHALSRVDGVTAVEVPGWREGRATITVAPGVTAAQLADAVGEAGYGAEEVSRRTATPERPTNGRDVDYDLVVIGTGGGGIAAAIKAAESGRRVGIVEAGVIGGTCVNIGCVPSKTLIRAAEAFRRAEHRPFAGIATQPARLDWKELIKQKDELVGELRRTKYVEVLKSYGDGITLMTGRAKLIPDGRVSLDGGRILRPGKIVVAAGAAPKVLPLPGIEGVDVLTSTTVMELETQPASIIIVGGRVIGLEIGEALARFGTKVTILQRSHRIIPEHEPEISEALAGYLREEGVTIHTGVKLEAARKDGEEKVLTATVEGERREFRA